MVNDDMLHHAGRDLLIEEIHSFACGSLQASAAIFYWIGDAADMQNVTLTGISPQIFRRYQAEMKYLDPLNISRLCGASLRVSRLQENGHLVSAGDYRQYHDFLVESDVSDVMEFLFWRDGCAFAGLGVMKTRADPSFSGESLNFARFMQPYMEFTLAGHPQLKQRRLEAQLGGSYHLTRREIEVARLIRGGCTNDDVSDELGITLATVKSHVMRIFGKLGVENRTSMASRITDLETGHQLPSSNAALPWPSRLPAGHPYDSNPWPVYGNG
jgi:DNA-binding CsgD family transcriptional regulator